MNTFKDLLETSDRLTKYDKDRDTKFYNAKWYEIIDYQLRAIIFFYIICPIIFFIALVYKFN